MRSNIQKTQEWHCRVADAANWPGSLESYCRSKGVSAPALRYWRKKLVSGKGSPFVPVEVVAEIEPRHRALPDPRWLAELINGLSGGVR